MFHWKEDPNPATGRCADCKSKAIQNPMTEADFVLAKQAEEAEQATNKSKEEARARNKGKAAAYKATAPVKKTTVPAKKAVAPAKKTPRFIPSQEALDRAKATAAKTPKKTRGAVEKAPKKTTQAAIKADQAMLMSAFTYHQKQAAEASAKGGNAG
ncbi:uncharacterized protein J4E92_006016 [Alternaria infectoria]|uniref:uncharacterized protein n=1 Tax=Alternaria infectoria TaxID=45303 RepID=UPI0022201CC7|nr:uncharacterized protein J4E92_006016 [Alternaria infectoria]KAI4926856.1 hypothetical protein J4E92_006016 [Alternaria infectoria]